MLAGLSADGLFHLGQASSWHLPRVKWTDNLPDVLMCVRTLIFLPNWYQNARTVVLFPGEAAARSPVAHTFRAVANQSSAITAISV